MPRPRTPHTTVAIKKPGIPQKNGKKKLRCFQRSFFLKKYKLLHGADDQTIAINSTFDGDTEEGVVPNVLAAGTGGGSAGRSATSQNQSHSSDSSNDEKLFHFFSPFIIYCSGYAGKTGATEKSFL